MSLIDSLARPLESLRKRNVHTWAGGYARWLASSAVPRARAAIDRDAGPRHLLFAFCDHYEPHWRNQDPVRAQERVRAWLHGYPTMVAPFRDADGLPPRHSYFFPGEEYTPGYLDALASLARRGRGEVELHLHHDGDTAENLRRTILEYLHTFA